MNKQYKKASEIAKQITEFSKKTIKPGMKLLDIADKIEEKMKELGATPGFPTNLAINDIAAHHTPSYNDESIAQDLLKVDFGVSIDGYVVDTAFSLDLTKDKKYEKLIQASREALKNAIKAIKENKSLGKIGQSIQNTITSKEFSPIINLSGHQIKQYDLHAGLTIPNYNNENSAKLNNGVYAIEPFATTGQGKVYEGKPSGIYQFIERKAVRDRTAREILNHIEKEYSHLPFCSRWLVKKFGTRALIALSNLEKAGILHQYEQLIEISHHPVSQAETTIIKEDNEIKILV